MIWLQRYPNPWEEVAPFHQAHDVQYRALRQETHTRLVLRHHKLHFHHRRQQSERLHAWRLHVKQNGAHMKRKKWSLQQSWRNAHVQSELLQRNGWQPPARLPSASEGEFAKVDRCGAAGSHPSNFST